MRSNPPSREGSVQLPQEHLAALARRGWEYRASNSAYAFFQKPGYWLRVAPGASNGYTHWASVQPEDFHVSGDTWPPAEFEPHERAPAITGRGAKTRALQAARELWTQHEAYLAPLSIELVAVGVRQFRSSGGAGSSINTRTYRRDDLGFQAPPPASSL